MPVSAADTDPANDRGFAVYIHWPFSLHKCPYCDFNSHVRDAVDQDVWQRALLREIDHEAARLGARRVESIFFGGGTPSLMPAATVEALLKRISGHWRLADDVEITLEANPTSVEAARFADLAAAGVNRLSLGVQALDDKALRALGRQHDVAEALAALKLAKQAFARVSFDLIYARPGQSPAQWRAELARAIKLAAGHLSLYQLTIEPGTAFFGQHQRGELILPGEDAQADFFDTTQELCAGAGLPAYETSNHAAAGQESRHNLVYWRYGEYLGIGPGAHGRVRIAGSRHAQQRLRLPEHWLRAVTGQGHGLEDEHPIAADERAREMLMMGLRLAQGVEASAFEAEVGKSLIDWLEREKLAELIDLGLVELSDEGLALTERGRPLLDAVLGRLLT